jgi:hypothetical protein
VSEQIPFQRYRNGHILTVPVLVGGSAPTRFVLDTGIGLNIVSTELCGRLGLAPTGSTYEGTRMSGQKVSCPLTRVPSLGVGAFRKEGVVAGMLNLDGFFPGGDVGGFLSPLFFDPSPFAINSVTSTLRIGPDGPEASRDRSGVEVPLTVERDGPSVSLFADLQLPNGATAKVEIDTGTDVLILHTRFMAPLGVDPDRFDVTRVEGTDETGHRFLRFRAPIHGDVRLHAAPRILQRDPAVMFQEIIYDGLLGDAFLRSYDVTYDLDRSRMVFADPTS